MCMLLKLDYAKFGVSNLFFSKVSEEKPLGVRLDPPLVKEWLKFQNEYRFFSFGRVEKLFEKSKEMKKNAEILHCN